MTLEIAHLRKPGKGGGRVGVLQKSWIDVREITDALALVTCLAWLCELGKLLEDGQDVPQDVFVFVGECLLQQEFRTPTCLAEHLQIRVGMKHDGSILSSDW